MTATSSPAPCPRSWEIEAVRDGRLREQDAESLRRHLRTCAPCQREQATLDALGRGLGELPEPRMDVLSGRRVRQRVLAEHNAWLLRRERTGAALPARSAWLAVAALVVLVGAGAAWGLHGAARPPAPSAVAERPPSVDVVASAGARWSERDGPHEIELSLESGELKLSIRRGSPSDRVLVRLPDGEIEDYGTVLRVAVTGGATDSVRVEQGKVALRLQNQAPISLAAGEAWQRAPAAVRPSASPSATLASPAPAVQTAVPHAESAARHVHAVSAPSVSTPSASAPAVPSTADAARAEDEAYLHVIELVQQGKVDGARAAAKDYLLRFPNGFRRVEVLNIATGTR